MTTIDASTLIAIDVHVHLEHLGTATAADTQAQKYFGASAERDWSALAEYYRAAQAPYNAALAARGFKTAEIGRHAGLADTSLMLAVEPSLVRVEAVGTQIDVDAFLDAPRNEARQASAPG